MGVNSALMNRILLFCLFVFGVNLALEAQKKLSEKELAAYDWICYNQSVDDWHELLYNDTLLLVKSYNRENLEPILDPEGNEIPNLYSRHWTFDFNEVGDSSKNDRFFSIYWIDLKAAALSRSVLLDSMIFTALKGNPELNSEATTALRPLLDALGEQESIIIRQTENTKNYFYIVRIDSKLVARETLKSRFILTPNGLSEGSWYIDKRQQLLYFKVPDYYIYHMYRIERMDDLHIRLILRGIMLR